MWGQRRVNLESVMASRTDKSGFPLSDSLRLEAMRCKAIEANYQFPPLVSTWVHKHAHYYASTAHNIHCAHMYTHHIHQNRYT